MSNTTSFGGNLRELREKKGISLRVLAKKIGVSAAFLSDIELGRRFPSDDRIEMLAAEIGVTAADLKQFDFRDEAEYIRQLMFADPAAGMVFRTVRSKIQGGMPAEEIHERLQD